ncbi:MAG: hypothetical protein KIH01_08050 [Candidatus Freyarchaeota archaeon]|nr:hypothetical protein [Candidatus Jordarchaeia archaeon]
MVDGLMSLSKFSMVFLVVALVSSIAFLQVSPIPTVLALTGEPPSYTPGDTWTYNITITNRTSGISESTTLTLSVSEGNIKDFNGTMQTCYTLKYKPALDIYSFIIFYIYSLEWGIFNGSVTEFLKILENESFSEFYITKSGYKLIGVHIYAYYFNDSYGINFDATMKLNESYPYPLKFPLEEGAKFGYYKEELNCSLDGHIKYYNATTNSWDEIPHGEYVPLGGEAAFFLFPYVNVTGTENLTVPAGTLECWKMESYLDLDLVIWYSPEAKGIAQLNMSFGDIKVSMILQSYSHAPTLEALSLYLLLYVVQQSSQQSTLFVAGVAAVVVVATLGVLAWRRLK